MRGAGIAPLLDLRGKRAAVSGATGGLGRELCRALAARGAALVLLVRNETKGAELASALAAEFPGTRAEVLVADFSSLASVGRAAAYLRQNPPDLLIHNAGAYCIPRTVSDAGYDNVFTIDFLAPYCLTRALLPTLRARGGRVVAVGSIAHRYAKTDPADVDFSTRTRASLVYGNAKRRLMFSLYGLFAGETGARLAVTHPGISFTGITAHYPPWLFALIRHPMKWIFMKPRRAMCPILAGCETATPCRANEWIGPRLFAVWGQPWRRTLHSCAPDEAARITAEAERLWEVCRHFFAEPE